MQCTWVLHLAWLLSPRLAGWDVWLASAGMLAALSQEKQTEYGDFWSFENPEEGNKLTVLTSLSPPYLFFIDIH